MHYAILAVASGHEKWMQMAVIICILTDALSDKPMELPDLDYEDMLKGISCMCDFEKFMQTEEVDTECASMDKEVDDVEIQR